MRYRSILVALVTLLCAQATVLANTTYNLNFGSYVNESLQDGTNNNISGLWTEVQGGVGNGGQQIVCMTAVTAVATSCAGPGSAGSGIPIYASPSNYSAWGGTSTSTFLQDDGDPDYGAPIYTALNNANGDLLTIGASYTLTYWEAANEESTSAATKYDDYWQIYTSTTATTGAYICPSTVCTPAVTSSSFTLASSSTEMVYTGGQTTPTPQWVESTYTFVATSQTEVIEFVTDAMDTNGEQTPGNFNPPILDLADITLTQNSTAPEPSTWVLTILGIGGACVAGKLRRRPSSASAAAMKRLKQS